MSRTCKNLILFLIAVLIIIFREYRYFTEPRFWAEEGTIYFSFAASHDWLSTLLRPHLGYYSLLNNLASVLASRAVPLEWAPLITTLSAFLVQCIPLVIVIFGRSYLWAGHFRKAVVIGIILFTPFSEEVWLNTINSQFYFSLITLLILCEDLDSNYIRKYFYRITIIIAGLTGVVSCYLAPLYLVRAYLTRKREAIIQAVLITVCTIVQITIAVLSAEPDMAAQGRFSLPNTPTLGFILWIKNFILPLFGEPIATAISVRILWGYRTAAPWLWPAGYGCFIFHILFLVFLFFRLDKNTAISVVGGYLLLALLTTYSAFGNKIHYINPIHSQRYYYVPNVLILMMVFLSIKWDKGMKWGSRFLALCLCGLLISGISNGIAIYRKSVEGYEYNPKWREEAARWKSDNTYVPDIWPPGWKLKLPERPSE